MLKLTNRLLRWLQSVPKPLSGLFRHLNRSKNEEVRPRKSPSSTCCLCIYKTHPSWMNLAHTHFKAWKSNTGHNRANGANRRTVKGTPAPNRLGTWAYGACDLARIKRWLTRYNCVTSFPRSGHMKNHGPYEITLPRIIYNDMGYNIHIWYIIQIARGSMQWSYVT
jgi:hypothetical protein